MKIEQYKHLGDYIHQVDVRNTDLTVSDLRGLSMSKEFRTSTSNVVGVDLCQYKIVNNNIFAFDPMSIIRVHKVPLVLNTLGHPVIISPAYITFACNNENELDPFYLKLWFMRSEFDRYADFKSDAAVRGGYGWNELCDTLVRIPDITEQKRIVAEYRSVTARIVSNKHTISKLEETQNCLFIEKVASILNHENLPCDWKQSNLLGVSDFLNGIACQKYEPEEGESSYPVIKIREMGLGNTDILSDRASTNIPAKYIIRKDDLLFSWSASLLVDIWCGEDGVLNQHIFKVIPKHYPKWFCYSWINYHLEQWNHFISAKATSMGHLKQEDLLNATVVIPSSTELSVLDKQFCPLFDYQIALKKEQILLNKLRKILLARLSN